MSGPDDRIIEFGEHRLDRDAGLLYRGDTEVALRPKAFDVLVYLAERPHTLVSKDELLSAIWGDVIVTEGALTQCIIDIRRALGDRELIRTVPKRGYLFEPGEEDSRGTSDEAAGFWSGPRKVGAAALAMAVVLALLLGLPPRAPEVEGSSTLAVLAFQDLTTGDDRSYLAEGLAEEILSKLAQVPGLQLVSRTASIADGVHEGAPRSIGLRLGATQLLEGSVRAQGDRVRVIARLVDADSGYERWAGDFDAQRSDLITIQETIAAAIAYELRQELMPEDVAVAIEVSIDDPVAYDLYLQARNSLRGTRDSAQVSQVLAWLDQALTRAPLFAEAEAAKCEAYRRQLNLTRDASYLDPAIRACRRATDLQPQLLEAQVALGRLLDRTGQYELARVRLAEAIERQPTSAEAHWALAEVLESSGSRADAGRHFERAVELDPASPNALGGYANHLVRSGELDAALDLFERAMQAAPNDPKYPIDAGLALLYAGRFAEAAAAFDRAVPLDRDAGVAVNNAGASHYLAGNYDRAHALFARAAEANPGDFAFWGNLGDACRLRMACEESPDAHYALALELVESELKVRPGDPELLAVSGQYLLRLGRLEEGLLAIERALSSEPSAKATLDAAVGYAAIGQQERAVELFDEAISRGYPEVLARALPDFE